MEQSYKYKPSWYKISLLVLGLIVIFVGGYFLAKKFRSPKGPENDPQKITLTQAAQVGEEATLKLLVQIEQPKGRPENMSGRYERGDIVLTAPADKEFSDAEKTGFLIIKMDLTEKQAELLSLSLKEATGGKDPAGNPETKDVKRRKFALDLAKIGIAPDDFKGKEITDKIFTWDALYLK